MAIRGPVEPYRVSATHYYANDWWHSPFLCYVVCYVAVYATVLLFAFKPVAAFANGSPSI